MTGQFWWFATRATGITAWLLLTASVLWGILIPGRMVNRKPAWTLSMHRWLAGLTVFFVGAHIWALVADSYVHFDTADVLIPLASDWKPVATALGAVSMWIIAAVQVTSWTMKRLPRRFWKWVHLSSYAAFGLGTLHGTLAGTDASNTLYLATTLLCVGAVVYSTVYRIIGGHPKRSEANAQGNKPLARPARASKVSS